MHVVELTAHHARIPLRKEIGHASFTRTENDTLIVCCRLQDGTLGWGEGLPRPYVTGESIESTFQQLRDAKLPAMLGESFDDLAGVIELCRGIRFDPPSEGLRDCFGNALRCAVELSILDAASRSFELPLSAVTDALPEAASIGRHLDQVRYSVVFTKMNRGAIAKRALLLRLLGFRQAKVKVGVPDADDARNLQTIRRFAGSHFDLRVDANEAFSCENLEARVASLEPFGISSIEQPVPHSEVSRLAGLRRNIRTPIMLDESLCSLGDAHRAVDEETCDLFNIRLSKCGGFLDSLRLGVVAIQSGLGFQLGCQVGETGVLSAAGRHFACSVGPLRYLEGSYDRFLVREPLTKQDLTFGIAGRAPALTGSGLGIDIDVDALQRVSVNTESWKIR